MKVLICDDSALVRACYVRQIRRLPFVSEVVEAADVAGARAAIDASCPSVVLLDYFIGLETALDVLHGIVLPSPCPRLLVFSADPEGIPQDLCRAAGAERIFDKVDDFPALLDFLRTVAAQDETGTSGWIAAHETASLSNSGTDRNNA
ncbi:hypothetical protein ACFOGJ_25080 [Marinibaculum pumilum]|uniref:Response regulatory domain-containing protein n=1 Tax=Marinibaculum pumilum TaxID=1766165 RepID=A0ABV7L7B3_9PROT